MTEEELIDLKMGRGVDRIDARCIGYTVDGKEGAGRASRQIKG